MPWIAWALCGIGAFSLLIAFSCSGPPPTLFLTTTTTTFTPTTHGDLVERAFVLHPSRSKTSLTTRTADATTQPPKTTTTTKAVTVKQTTTTELAVGYGGGTDQGIPPKLRRIGGCESSGRPDGPLVWKAYNQNSGASGAFQYLKSTWNRYKGYLEARHAPPEIQIERALSDFKRSTSPWASSRGCWN